MRENAEQFTAELEETIVLMKTIFSRLNESQCLKQSEREHLAYRIGEILITCKQVYTNCLPFLLKSESKDKDKLFDFLAELRMNFLHLKDLVDEFETSFLASLSEEEEEEEKGGEEEEA